MNAARIELLFIGFVVVVLALAVSQWPPSMQFSQFVLILSGIFLFQTLLRDVWLLIKRRLYPATSKPRTGQCFCVESLLGISAVILGLALLLANLGGTINLSREIWLASIGLVLLACYWLRDYVFSWRPWRIYRDPDHANIILGRS